MKISPDVDSSPTDGDLQRTGLVNFKTHGEFQHGGMDIATKQYCKWFNLCVSGFDISITYTQDCTKHGWIYIYITCWSIPYQIGIYPTTSKISLGEQQRYDKVRHQKYQVVLKIISKNVEDGSTNLAGSNPEEFRHRVAHQGFRIFNGGCFCCAPDPSMPPPSIPPPRHTPEAKTLRYHLFCGEIWETGSPM